MPRYADLPARSIIEPQREEEKQQVFHEHPVPFATVLNAANRHAAKAADTALLASFDPSRAETRVIRASLADRALPIPDSSTQPQQPQHPYPPRRGYSVSLAATQGHAYVYGAKQGHAAEALRSLGSTHHLGPTAVRSVRGQHVALNTAQARVDSLYQQLQRMSGVRQQQTHVRV